VAFDIGRRIIALLYRRPFRRALPIVDPRLELEACRQDLYPRVLELWRERGQPAVRAELARAWGRWDWLRFLPVAVLPLAAAGGLLYLSGGPIDRRELSDLLLLAAGLWPVVTCTGAALSSAMAVRAEIGGETAEQLILTPMSKRALAASKVLPRAYAWMAGTLLALPLYLLAGCCPALVSPLLLWPYRLLAPLVSDVGFESRWFALLVGPAMCLADLCVVWAAAHWGAACAVRRSGLGPVIGRMLVGAVYFAVITAGCAVPSMFILLPALALINNLGRLSGGALLLAFGGMLISVGGAVAAFGALYYFGLLMRAVREALFAFAYFDRLAGPDFDPPRTRASRRWTLLIDRLARR
jgi:hypothetical protein